MSAGSLLLRGGKVFGPDGVLTAADVLIRDDVIAEVGRQVQVPEAATVVELAGRVVLPGLIDAHTHLTHGYAQAVTDEAAAQGVRSTFQALRALRAGLTAVRELGSYRQVDIALRDAIAAAPS